MKSILIFYDYFSPAYKAGGPIRSLQNLTALLSESCRMYVYTSAVDLGGAPLTVEKDQWVPFSKNVEVFYGSLKGLSVKCVYQQLRRIRPEVVYINGLFTPYAVLYPLLALRFLRLKDSSWQPKIVLAPRGMLKPSALSLKAPKKKLYLRVFKALGLHKGLHWQATDPQEQADIQLFSGKKGPLSLLGNVPLVPSSPGQHTKAAGSLRLVSVSLIARTKNLLFLLKCLKEVPAGLELSYDIYGPIKEEDYWQLLQGAINQLPSHIQVNYKGAIPPEEVTDLLQQYDCFVLPTLGENFGHAIFEALGAGVPVLISNQTPWKELEQVRAGWDLPLQQKPWIEKLKELTDMPDPEFQHWHQGAHAYAVAYLEEKDLKQQYLELFGIL
ncbi:glycosyltransferase [Nafulsella turpanensis]|uniref:glycosyltransferase n=1 Tax=Nafulsella turpanensis TaxID=1265690 RepID=UPI0003478D9F|nr:glycosyltransferase [Nafulsella turpanensis]